MGSRRSHGVVLARVLTVAVSAPILTAAACLVSAAPIQAQASIEQPIADLKSANADVRYRAATVLEDAANPDAAAALAAAIADPDNDVQVEAIHAELNTFLARKVVSRRRVGLVIERRGRIDAESSFAEGRSAVGAVPVPVEVATALARAAHDDSPAVATEALYAFGTLAPEVAPAARPDMLRAAAPELAALLGAPAAETRQAALRVAARVYARRPGDAAPDALLGDAVIGALNERDTAVRLAAMDALGAMRDGRAVQALTELFQYFRRGAPAEHALDALAHIANPASEAIFTAQLSARSTAMKAMAVEGLARVGDAAHLSEIESAVAGGRSDSLALASAFASARLAHATLESIVEALAQAKLHDQAFEYLVELAPGRSKEFLEGAKDPDPRLRAAVADILGLAGDPAAAPIVEAMRTDEDPQVQHAAERAAARLHGAR